MIISNQIQKNKNLEEDGTLFKAIKEEKFRIVAKQKASANFVTTILYNFQPQAEGKKS